MIVGRTVERQDGKTVTVDPSSTAFQFESEGLFRLAVDSLHTGVLVVAPDGTIVLANAELARQFGYRREELVGRSVERLVPESLRAIHPTHREGFKANPSSRSMGEGGDISGRRRDGSEFPVEIGLTPLETPEGVFVLASVVDLTARRAAERTASAALQRQLEFERLVTELSHKFINLPSEQILQVLEEGLRRSGETLGVDRCAFWRMQADGRPVVPISWRRSDVDPISVVAAPAEEFPWAFATLLNGQTITFGTLEEVPHEVDRASFRALGIRSAVSVPLSVSGRVVGGISFHMTREERSWGPDALHTIQVVASVFGHVVARGESDEALKHAMTEVERLRDKLHAENQYLRREVDDHFRSGLIIGQSPVVRQVMEQLRQVAATDSTVLLLGETGTGKELFATYLHGLSARRSRIMVRVNCSAIPTTLIESELFGREKGAFTGALARQIGRFELADHSTIFLDEIGELPAEVQVKLLRVLEERQIERLGSPKSIKVDVRVVAATHRNLEQRITDGAFREDLFYRLNVFPIHVPPLRDRVEDIPLLVWRFVTEFSKTFGKRIDTISRENMAALQRYSWPGNIRELRNVVERAMIMATGSRLTVTLPAAAGATGKRSLKLVEVEREHMLNVLKSAGWRVRGTGGAADQLGLKPTTLETRMAKLGISRPRPA
jgi:PAS domain S-box-containing protein